MGSRPAITQLTGCPAACSPPPQVSWFSFQFVCEELAEQLEALHAATDAVLRKLPA